MKSHEKNDLEMNEYSALRAEIISKQERKIDVWLHMYILYGALFSLGIETDNKYFLLLTYLIIIPYQVMQNNCEWNVSRISAYIHTIYEENSSTMRWEGFNNCYTKYTDYLHKKTRGLIGFVRKAGSIHLAILTTGFYLYRTLEHNRVKPFETIDYITIGLSIILAGVTIWLNNPNIVIADEELVKIMQEFKKEGFRSEESEKTPDSANK